MVNDLVSVLEKRASKSSRSSWKVASTPARFSFTPTQKFTPETTGSKMTDVLLFDLNSMRRQVWGSLCAKRGVALQSFVEVADSHLLDPVCSRVIILDESVLEGWNLELQHVLKRFRHDSVAFSFKQCSVSTAAKLISLGACWVFDNSLHAAEFDEGFDELLLQAQTLNEQLSSFRRCESIRAKITAGERDVLELVIQGLPNKLIAKKLDISTRTVETRRSKVYRKCEVHNVTELVRFIARSEALQARFKN